MAHPKGVLIERMQKDGKQPVFKTEASGPDHEPTFNADVVVDGEVLGSGRGGNKKDAEKRAAEEALKTLDQRERGEPKSDKKRPIASGDESPYVEPPFEGPWPVFERVLAAALEIANARVDGRKRGEDSVEEIRDLALKLYKETLEDLGEVVEVGEDYEG